MNTCIAKRHADSRCSNCALSVCIVLCNSAKCASDNVTHPFSEFTVYAIGFVVFSSKSSISLCAEIINENQI